MRIASGDLTLNVRTDGAPTAPPLVLLHSLGTNLHVWDAQAEALAATYFVIRPDLRGHGESAAPPGPYTIAAMAADVLAVLDSLQVERAHVAGLSIGGVIAQSLAATAPARIRSLILVDTAMTLPPAAMWHERAAIARAQGLEPLIPAILGRWLTPDCQHGPEADTLRAMLRATAPEGYAGAAEALAEADLTASTATLRLPTLILVGEHDAATPPAAARALQASIEGADLQVLPNAAHIPTVQTPQAVTDAMAAFLARLA